MSAYYNEHDPFAASWLRELIKAGHIAAGEVDERSIEDVRPEELRGFSQCHFFAGIGVWSYALRQAGWPDGREVWTGSCPCQPFSTAGKRQGFSDERHLWPTLYQLIRKCRPATFFGEQVASKDGLSWFESVYSDLEDASYAIGAADLCAAGFGAPHIRQRLYFVGSLEHTQSEQMGISRRSWQPRSSSRLDHATSEGLPERTSGAVFGGEARGISERPSDISAWEPHDEIWCVDGRTRPVEPGTFPLAHGATNRVGRLRGYGNALVAPVATAFIEAFLETEKQ